MTNILNFFLKIFFEKREFSAPFSNYIMFLLFSWFIKNRRFCFSDEYYLSEIDNIKNLLIFYLFLSCGLWAIGLLSKWSPCKLSYLFAGKIKGIAFIKDPDGYWIEIFDAKTIGKVTASAAWCGNAHTSIGGKFYGLLFW